MQEPALLKTRLRGQIRLTYGLKQLRINFRCNGKGRAPCPFGVDRENKGHQTPIRCYHLSPCLRPRLTLSRLQRTQKPVKQQQTQFSRRLEDFYRQQCRKTCWPSRPSTPFLIRCFRTPISRDRRCRFYICASSASYGLKGRTYSIGS